MIVQGMHFDATMFAGFVAMLGITIVAAPGVPGRRHYGIAGTPVEHARLLRRPKMP